MRSAALLPPTLPPTPAPPKQSTAVAAPARAPEFRFLSLVITEHESKAKAHGATFSVSLLLHTALVLAVVIVPLLFEDVLPVPGDTLRAFFVAPADVAPPPPPPPPPAAGVRASRRAPVAPRPAEPATFVAPVEVQELVVEEEGLDLGVEGGVPGGVEGGVPGGVIGGVVGGLPTEAPPPPTRVVRIGGAIVAPKLVKKVEPVYPPLAAQARLQGIVIIEAYVDTRGFVKSVKVLRGQALLDDAATEAVRQWRYQPLLLNGEPTEFILVATLVFNLTPAVR
jgi:protein TonB